MTPNEERVLKISGPLLRTLIVIVEFGVNYIPDWGIFRHSVDLGSN